MNILKKLNIIVIIVLLTLYNNNYAMVCVPNKNLSSEKFFTKIYSYKNNTYVMYGFVMENDIKIKYFSQNGYSKYTSWKKDKDILLVCSGAFSETWSSNSKPVGFTIDNGDVVNMNMDSEMDGLVFIFEHNIEVIDLDYLQSGIKIDNNQSEKLNPRKSLKDRIELKNMAVEDSFTIFQTQLLYSQDGLNKNLYDNLDYGKRRERRFLAVCSKKQADYSIIIDAPDLLHLNQSALYAKSILESEGYIISYMLNLDTGDKNILLAKDKNVLVSKGNININKATNLIIFYR